MGLLDDAIRQHLELKRSHGAEAEELSRLEQEAFSPPSRPGDPDFGPESDTAGEESESAEPFGADQGEDRAPEQISGAEAGRLEHSGLDDTVPHPVTDEDATITPEPPPEAPESAIFAGDDDLAIDLDLEIDDEDDGGASAAVPPAPTLPLVEKDEDDFLAGADFESAFDLDPASIPERPAPELEDPLPTGEQPAPVIPDDEPLEEERLLEEEAAEDLAEPGDDDVAADEGSDDDDEDILEETPDFLKEAPDGESLWFEQGKPKDFDFGDED